jgi:hypothetical protein
MQTLRHMDNHDIAPIQDPNFEMKDFMLKVYEDAQEVSMAQGWKDKITGNKGEKLKDILEFCKDEAWKAKPQQEVLADFIDNCAKSRTSGKLMTNTRTMQKLVSALNDAYTPEIVREQFVQILAIDVLKIKDSTKIRGLVRI